MEVGADTVSEFRDKLLVQKFIRGIGRYFKHRCLWFGVIPWVLWRNQVCSLCEQHLGQRLSVQPVSYTLGLSLQDSSLGPRITTLVSYVFCQVVFALGTSDCCQSGVHPLAELGNMLLPVGDTTESHHCSPAPVASRVAVTLSPCPRHHLRGKGVRLPVTVSGHTGTVTGVDANDY